MLETFQIKYLIQSAIQVLTRLQAAAMYWSNATSSL